MDTIVREISDLYELSLSIGAGLDARANCEQFLSVLLARRNLAYGAIWVANGSPKSQDSSYRLLCARPNCKAVNPEITALHPLLSALEKDTVQVWAAEDAPFPEFLQSNQIDKGYIALMQLAPRAFLLLQGAAPSSLSGRALRQMRPVLKKFAVTLEGCLAFEQLREETRQRKIAQEEAEKARRSQQQFLANVSHEIRTPMNALLGMVHLLRDTNLDSHQQEYLNVMRFASDNLMDLINNILDASKIEAGEVVLDPRPFNLHALLSGLHQSWQLRIKDKPVQLVYEPDLPKGASFIGDPMRLQQVLNNLLNNASKFTASGTIRLSASELSRDQQRAKLQIVVSDTGQGIEEEYLPHIFDQFKQGRKSVGQGQAGTGLGLAIVRELLTLMGGEISVQSQAGAGAEFAILLPLPVDERSEKAPDKGPAINPEALRGMRVLVAEDNLMNQKLAERILQKFGCKFEIVQDGREAVRCCAEKAYDLILMDIHMPEMDGLEAARRIRMQGRNIHTPIIALTAAALLEERNRGLASGMNDFVTKPFAPELLQRTMLKWLSEASATQAADAPPELEPAAAERVDLTYLRSMSGGDEAFVADMLQAFLEEIPLLIQGVEAHLQNRAAGLLYELIHRFKPNFATLGLKQQEKNCAGIERMAKAEYPDWPAIDAQCRDLLRVARHAKEQLLAHC